MSTQKSKGFLENTLKGSMGRRAGQTAGRIRAELEKFTLEEKIGIIGSLITIGSLFLNWYSDVDVFRTGDTFTGLSGPLMVLGFTMLILSIGNAVMIAAKAFKIRPFASWKLGKTQLWIGSASLYFLVATHFIYFNPQFGLNILSKQSETGVMVCLLGIVMTCLGGFLAYRKDGAPVDVLEDSRAETFDQVAKVVKKVVAEKEIRKAEMAENNYQPAVEPVMNEIVVETVETMPAEAPKPANAALDNFRKLMEKERKLGSKTTSRPGLNSMAQQSVSNERIVENARPVMQNTARPKTEYERSQVYDHLKKMMERDSMTPEQRKKLRTKESAENVFSAKMTAAKPKVSATVSRPAVKSAPAASASAGGGDLLRSAMLRKKN